MIPEIAPILAKLVVLCCRHKVKDFENFTGEKGYSVFMGLMQAIVPTEDEILSFNNSPNDFILEATRQTPNEHEESVISLVRDLC